MNEFVNNVAALAMALAVLWVATIGFTVVIQRRDWATAILAWPFRMSFRLIRWVVGGFFLGIANIFIAIGRAIRGR